MSPVVIDQSQHHILLQFVNPKGETRNLVISPNALEKCIENKFSIKGDAYQISASNKTLLAELQYP
jgi:hypothetical protein